MVADIQSVSLKIEENEAINKKSKAARKKLISEYFTEFANNSSIHGLKYFVDGNWFEKSFWFLVLFFSIYTCVVLIKSTWQKWEENPVFISFSQTPVNLWEIPFPAVTVCAGHRINRKTNFTFAYYHMEQGNKSWEMGNASSFCDNDDAKMSSSYYTEYDEDKFFEGTNWTEFLVKTALFTDQMFIYCNWDEMSCPTLFTPVPTPWGVCFSFNMLDKKEIFHNLTHQIDSHGNQQDISHWTFEKNYAKTNEDVYPRRSATIKDDFFFWLNSHLDKFSCRGDDYRIMLHHPAEVPSYSTHRIYLKSNKSCTIFIKPDITFTSNDLKPYSPHRRKCFYSDEPKLQFFKIYTLNNCQVECLANYTLKMCGCVPYYMPHKKTTPLCAFYNYWSIVCVKNAEGVMLKSESGVGNNTSLPPCDCLPSCNYINYNTDVKITDYSAITPVSIRFKDIEFVALERQELFGDVNFWASCGGLLGLFTGFSIVSLAEIVYYLFFKWTYNLGKRCLKSRLKF